MTCRICTAPVGEVLDLGESPPANALKRSPSDPEDSYPLVLEWCESCGNLQLRDTLSPELLYPGYRYVTPDSPLLGAHYTELLSYLETGGYVGRDSFVVEAGSNAGQFLAHIRPSVGGVLGVDPAEEISAMANEAGIPTICAFFDAEVAGEIAGTRGKANLVVARHCLAHNPSPHPMLAAATTLLTDTGYIVIENAYAIDTIANAEFDQIYHEHMFYFSITSMRALLAQHALRLVDVMLAPVHGGSIVFVAARAGRGPETAAVGELESAEADVLNGAAMARFARQASETRATLRDFLAELRDRGKSVYSYGATAKGTTLLNYVGVTSADIPYCVDSTRLKQGLFLPKSNIEVISEERGIAERPDYYLLTAWNYAEEITSKVRSAGNLTSRFIVPIPSVRVA